MTYVDNQISTYRSLISELNKKITDLEKKVEFGKSESTLTVEKIHQEADK